MTMWIPPFDRPLWAGYFFAWSNRYGDNPAAPGNVTVVTEPAVLARVPGPVMVHTPLIDEAAGLGLWDRVVAIYAESEGEPERLPSVVLDARRRMWMRGLARRPVVAYQADEILHVYQDWWGVQAYFEHEVDVLAALEPALSRLQRVPVLLICQAYDRRTTADPSSRMWTREAALANLQLQCAEVARRWPNVIGLLWFSDGRPGGTREYPMVRAWHEAIVAAIPRRPEILSLPTAARPEVHA